MATFADALGNAWARPGLAEMMTNLGFGLMTAGQGGGPVGQSRMAAAAPYLTAAVAAPRQAQQQQLAYMLANEQMATAKAKREREATQYGERTDLANMLVAPDMMPMSEMEGGGANPYAQIPQAQRAALAAGLRSGMENPAAIATALVPKEKDAPAGYAWAQGRLIPIPGGPADPATIATEANARNPFYMQEVRREDGTIDTVAIPRAALMSVGNAGGQPAAPTTDGLPAGAKVISSKPATMTEAQANAATYADRMVASHDILNSVESQGTSVWGRAMEDIPGGNYLQSDVYQKFEQARRDFINATLRKESGAVISSEEFKNAEKQYFPKPGDSAEVIAQKRANREAAIKGIGRAAGPSYKPNVPEKTTSDGMPLVGNVEQGYRFKGGNPADPKNWEKI